MAQEILLDDVLLVEVRCETALSFLLSRVKHCIKPKGRRMFAFLRI